MDRYRMMCSNVQRAKENRERIKNKYAHAYWDALEATIRSTPFGVALPAEVPLGELRQVGKNVTREQITLGIEADEENIFEEV